MQKFSLGINVSLGHSGLMHGKVFLGNQMSVWAILGLCIQRFSLGITSHWAILWLQIQSFPWELDVPSAIPRQHPAKSVESDVQNVAPDQGLHCLQYFR